MDKVGLGSMEYRKRKSFSSKTKLIFRLVSVIITELKHQIHRDKEENRNEEPSSEADVEDMCVTL